MDLVRNLNTEVVHRPGCASKGKRYGHWAVADDMHIDEVSDTTAVYPWLHLCRVCIPGKCQCNRCGGAQ